ncbi:MAG: YbhB/YbcL family Raf kinase inhibitor-like protein [Verrucomicrobia bacterium]|nr:MAG: YbhB/YbcL family Raf kinase inhibitor-like protein [Verrucomicrobiota bacterium]
MKVRFTVVGLLLLLVGCASPAPPAKRQLENVNLPQTAQPAMQVTSTAFKEGQPIPRQYTCDGVNISPPLEWNGTPKSAKTIAIIADDPDAPSGTFVHWVVYNLPAENIGLVENLPTTESLKAGGFQGKNDFQKIGYGGPCPPSGTHRYFFKVYALDSELALKAGATKADVEKAMQGHIVAQAQLMGTYRRQ